MQTLKTIWTPSAKAATRRSREQWPAPASNSMADEVVRAQMTGESVPAASLLALAAVHAVSVVVEGLVSSTIKYGYDDAARREVNISLALEPAQVILGTHKRPQ